MDWKAFYAPQVSDEHTRVLKRVYKFDVLSTSFPGNILACPSNEEKEALFRNAKASVLATIVTEVKRRNSELSENEPAKELEAVPNENDPEVLKEYAKVAKLIEDKFAHMDKSFQ
ncbi:hypothetical protein CYMTET_10516 [Cymbomonas tetramitiformis]|uniref:Uncharacterized protein n=1 Tax=Cymbomonas tetramitiformis TaxID=36881 RepID=A0AAE0GP40_9CHLO|nr:hypothetical protein CYMTET_10516 [Cymbomonas tetramitiformis]|eukprot:gene26087-31951_t